MKKRSHKRVVLLIFALILLGLGLSCYLWVRKEQRQYGLNRQLIGALMKGDAKEALALVEAGADPNTRFTPPPAPSFHLLLRQFLSHESLLDANSPTALTLACGEDWPLSARSDSKWMHVRDDLPLVQSMLRHGADVNAKMTDGDTVLMAALFHRNVNTIELLLKQGANVNAPDADGMTPLMYAAFNGYADEVELLLAHGANINAQDQSGNTALHHALGKFMDKDIVKQLLGHGADPNRPDKSGMTPLQYVQQRKQSDLVSLMQHREK